MRPESKVEYGGLLQHDRISTLHASKGVRGLRSSRCELPTQIFSREGYVFCGELDAYSRTGATRRYNNRLLSSLSFEISRDC